VLYLAEWKGLFSNEHFTVDSTQIEAWTSMKSCVAKDGSSKPPEDGGRNPTVEFKGKSRSNDTHKSTTDPEARHYKKSEGDKAHLAYLGHALMENRNGLVVDVKTTQTTGTAEREAAKAMAARTVTRSEVTLGADKNYDTTDFVQSMRGQGVTPRAARKAKGSAIDKRTTRHAGYAVSLNIRKRVAEVFGWSKTVGPLRKARFVGLATVNAQTVFTFSAYKLTRMATIFGWRLSTA
jgi:IS5 family transposase